jgi:hypothetical protein
MTIFMAIHYRRELLLDKSVRPCRYRLARRGVGRRRLPLSAIVRRD